ncbi:uncharacterized protein K489DRAFT_385558 [Dissoconium aciculare CBS 342.82]|uniref:Uncharacterized protein n=1 Tax=Dissoconium aciculare CBS 342.82 TaxID=1314786 RepID=A0A6J3LQ21_9PEZI|nr:uncharacterized protein K489DRAFT_385558 [Dissoconium aciculare CBS 342.82]KAF1817748.1 hypothetical protein K489DRAFT_385558 [Dissoconium aciculare CBS 342.82]
MESPKKAASTPRGWTDAEKLGILFQLISRPIPWETIELPPGRTLKAVQVMIDKEKSKIRKAQAGDGEANFESIPVPTLAAKGKSKAASACKAKGVGKKRGADDKVKDEDLEDDEVTESPIAARKKVKAASAPAKKTSKAGKAKQATVEDDESRGDSPQVKDEMITDEGEGDEE